MDGGWWKEEGREGWWMMEGGREGGMSKETSESVCCLVGQPSLFLPVTRVEGVGRGLPHHCQVCPEHQLLAAVPGLWPVTAGPTTRPLPVSPPGCLTQHPCSGRALPAHRPHRHALGGASPSPSGPG